MNPPQLPPIRVALTKDQREGAMQAFVENLPKWRDATLVLAGVAYVLGYLSWAIYASDHGWGLAPVLDAQYFTAGVLPALIVIAACFVGWWLRWLSQWVRRPVSALGTRIRSILEVAGILSILAGFIFVWFFRRAAPVSGALVIVIGGVALIISSFLSRDKIDSWYHRFVLSLAWVQLPLMGICAFLFYIAKIFPVLPQPLGGPRAECVQVDLDVSKVSTETLQLLAPSWKSIPTPQAGIARSRKLYLILQSGGYLLLQTNREMSSANNQLFRLQSSAVTSLVPVKDDDRR
jgi:hypothetical protein